MYDRILVAVDHSEMSDRAVRAARDLAVLSKGEVWVLHLRERETGAKTGALVMACRQGRRSCLVTASAPAGPHDAEVDRPAGKGK